LYTCDGHFINGVDGLDRAASGGGQSCEGSK
jgi:hypothetical protein